MEGGGVVLATLGWFCCSDSFFLLSSASLSIILEIWLSPRWLLSGVTVHPLLGHLDAICRGGRKRGGRRGPPSGNPLQLDEPVAGCVVMCGKTDLRGSPGAEKALLKAAFSECFRFAWGQVCAGDSTVWEVFHAETRTCWGKPVRVLNRRPGQRGGCSALAQTSTSAFSCYCSESKIFPQRR